MSFKTIILSTLICTFSFFQSAFAGGHGQANAFGFALVVPAEEVERVETLLMSHKNFMENTHSVTGDASTRLNSYSVIRMPEMVPCGPKMVAPTARAMPTMPNQTARFALS